MSIEIKRGDVYIIADAINNLAKAIERLGLNNAVSSMGAIELLAFEVKRLAERLDANHG